LNAWLAWATLFLTAVSLIMIAVGITEWWKWRHP